MTTTTKKVYLHGKQSFGNKCLSFALAFESLVSEAGSVFPTYP